MSHHVSPDAWPRKAHLGLGGGLVGACQGLVGGVLPQGLKPPLAQAAGYAKLPAQDLVQTHLGLEGGLVGTPGGMWRRPPAGA